ncbi:MAG: hypothetical protein ACXADL_06870 [Candidatus Thorarchaeota archaeon]
MSASYTGCQMLPSNRISKMGLFSSDPWSTRVDKLDNAMTDLGVKVARVIPWKVSRTGSTGIHKITIDDYDLSELDSLLVLDLGANDIGAFFNRVGLLSALQEMGVEIINSGNNQFSVFDAGDEEQS